MIKERKEAISHLVAELSRSQSPEAGWARELISLLFEDAKDRLIDATGEDIPRIQGEARLMERLTRQMIAANALLGQQ